MNQTRTSILFVLCATILLTANFYGHTLSTLPIKRFLNNEFPSESFVISRMIYNETEGLESSGNFMVRYPFINEIFMATSKASFEDIRQKGQDNIENASLYSSHLGFQDNLMQPLWSALWSLRNHVIETSKDGSRWQQRMLHYDTYYILQISQFCVALFNALIITLILLWVQKQFTIKTAMITLALILILMPGLTFFGRSMWWMMGIWFLPFLLFAAAYRWNEGRPLSAIPLILTSLLAAATLTLKTTMGYEYTSTIMVSAVIPATFYAILNRWPLKTWLAQCFVIGLCQIAGFTLTLYLHYQALLAIGLDPIETIKERFAMRAYGGENMSNINNEAMSESVQANLLTTYTRQFFQPQGIGIPQAIIMFPLTLWLWKKRKDFKTLPQEKKALLACIALGFFGALSMYTILKGHAYIHGYDVIAWSIPMNIMLCILYAQLLISKMR